MEFIKMHGLGNDYVFVNGDTLEPQNPSALSVCMSDRHFGIGSDGLVIYKHISNNKYSMRIFNSDGSEAEICGNALRCLAKLIAEKDRKTQQHSKNEKLNSNYSNKLSTEENTTCLNKLANKAPALADFDISSDIFNEIKKTIPLPNDFYDLIISTKCGDRACRAYFDEQNKVTYSLVDMGVPKNLDELNEDIKKNVRKTLTALDKTYNYYFVNVGNPHVIIFTNKEISDEEFYKVAPLIEKNTAFRDGANVEFVTVESPKKVKMRVWERGSGETLACGSGACAVGALCVLTGKTEKSLLVCCYGGELVISFFDKIFMLGESVSVFSGNTLI